MRTRHRRHCSWCGSVAHDARHHKRRRNPGLLYEVTKAGLSVGAGEAIKDAYHAIKGRAVRKRR